MTDTCRVPYLPGNQRKGLTQGSSKEQLEGQHGQRLQSQAVLTAHEFNSTLSPLSAPTSPLEIEEILYEIVSYIDKHSIHNYVSVSRIFYRASIRALWSSIQWRNMDHPFLAEFDRFGHYAVELHDSYHADLDRIARICTNLRELRLNWTPPTDEKLENIFRSSPKISSLLLYSCVFLTPQGLAHIASLSRLRRLELRNMIQIDEASLVTLLRSCPLLEQLKL
ncbi:hypothetical protein BGZ65_009822, partial [Modicella reniformis]